MGFRNENNEIVGFDIDVAKEVCKRLNVELVIQPISWNAKEQELNSGNIDCIWNGMSITEERKQAMLLSDSYMKNRMVFITKQDSNLKTLEDLKTKSRSSIWFKCGANIGRVRNLQNIKPNSCICR